MILGFDVAYQLDDLIGGHLVEILKLCWSQDPQARPFFSQISPRLKELDGGLK